VRKRENRAGQTTARLLSQAKNGVPVHLLGFIEITKQKEAFIQKAPL
jgi:hypothetical protein